jgi:hypothetical protein
VDQAAWQSPAIPNAFQIGDHLSKQRYRWRSLLIIFNQHAQKIRCARAGWWVQKLDWTLAKGRLFTSEHWNRPFIVVRLSCS